MTNDFEIIETSTDIEFFVNDNSYTSADVMQGIDTVLDEIEKTGDFDLGSNALRSLSAVNRVSGWASAKLCWGMMIIWKNDGGDPDRFYTDCLQDTTPLSELTVERYIKAWEGRRYILSLMDDAQASETSAAIDSLPIKNGVALGNAVAQGYELTKEQAEKIVTVYDNSSFLKVIRDVKGKQERKNTLTLYLELDGSIVAWMNNKREFVGYLVVKSRKDIVKKAVERIKYKAGLQEKKG